MMSINSIDYLYSAEKMLVENKDEITIRNAISRAYYSGFHSANSLVTNEFKQSRDWMDINAGMHMKLIRSLESFSGCIHGLDKQKARKLARQLKWLKTKREIADYDLNKNLYEVDAQQTIVEAKKLVEESSEILIKKIE
ncbi:hypothetical protein AHYW_001371 [Providencia manganoxydans]|uniref:hypothetical protein n=2 Tax=Providencia manganoxydans TaxID=2923283 RepID=UPI003B9D0ADF